MKTIRIISVIIAFLLLIYLVVIILFLKDSKQDDVCKDLIVNVQNSKEVRFISEANIVTVLKQTGFYPVGRQMSAINTDKIEKELLKNEVLERVDVYKTPSGIIRVDAKQKTPIMRVLGTEGSFYIDTKGSLMPVSLRYAVYVPVASGYIRKEWATTGLYEFALFLQENEFWNSQIEQIYVHPDREVELAPRVGEHRILLGTLDDFREKLDNLQLFYEQAIPKVGWGKYSVINLKFKNQIVCTKK
ncbi:MAG: cell division protein FtsQ [Tannerellaceae bacterium]|jgi:cell division protein FtsQ|nr:cell division protein FtsQ [Tannerellaceae bacterium]